MFPVIYMYMIHSDRRPVSNRCPLLKSPSTDVIISNHGRILGYFQIGILSPFSQICSWFIAIKSTSFSEQRSTCYLVTWWMFAKFMHYLHCILYQINAKHQSSRQTFSAPDPRFICKKAHQRPSYSNKFENKV